MSCFFMCVLWQLYIQQNRIYALKWSQDRILQIAGCRKTTSFIILWIDALILILVDIAGVYIYIYWIRSAIVLLKVQNGEVIQNVKLHATCTCTSAPVTHVLHFVGPFTSYLGIFRAIVPAGSLEEMLYGLQHACLYPQAQCVHGVYVFYWKEV